MGARGGRRGEIVNVDHPSLVPAKKKEKEKDIRSEEERERCSPPKRLGMSRLDKHGRGAGEGRDEAEDFWALMETRSELVVGDGEFGEQTLL